jgi:hypothetical protein
MVGGTGVLFLFLVGRVLDQDLRTGASFLGSRH